MVHDENKMTTNAKVVFRKPQAATRCTAISAALPSAGFARRFSTMERIPTGISRPVKGYGNWNMKTKPTYNIVVEVCEMLLDVRGLWDKMETFFWEMIISKIFEQSNFFPIHNQHHVKTNLQGECANRLMDRVDIENEDVEADVSDLCS